MAGSTAWQISRGPATSHRCVKCVLSYIKSRGDERMWYSPYTLSRLTALLTWAASGLDVCCDLLLQRLQGVPRTCSFYIIILVRTSILLVPSLKLIAFHVWNVTRSKSRHHIGGIFFCSLMFYSVLTRNSMHTLPLPLCGLYSIRVQNGCGQHRPCKIVLLTLVAPRGVTDL